MGADAGDLGPFTEGKIIHITTRIAGIAMVAALGLGLAACSPMTAAPEEDTSSAPTEAAMDPAFDDLVGSGCAAYAEQVPDGGGSIVGMSQDPVAVAASNNPLLTTLVAAVSGQLNPDVDLVDTLNGSEFTVFAPVDEAFGKIDAATIEALKLPENAGLLTSILTYHVVEGQILPADIVGTHPTLQGGTVEVTGMGDALMVNDANVICGGVHTANATVYLIDTVLMPAE